MNDKAMSLLDHLRELRRRLAISLGAILVLFLPSYSLLAPQAIHFLASPLARPLQSLSIAEAFLLRIEVSFLLATALASPIVAHEIWAFVAPGLYPRERRGVLGLTSASLLLAAAGAGFSLFLLLPLSVQFFLGEASALGVEYLAGADSYVRFCLFLTVACAAAFQLPLALLALGAAGIATPEWLRQTRRHWIVGIFFLSAILTPTGDIFTMSALAVPMWILFEVTVVAIGRMAGRG